MRHTTTSSATVVGTDHPSERNFATDNGSCNCLAVNPWRPTDRHPPADGRSGGPLPCNACAKRFLRLRLSAQPGPQKPKGSNHQREQLPNSAAVGTNREEGRVAAGQGGSASPPCSTEPPHLGGPVQCSMMKNTGRTALGMTTGRANFQVWFFPVNPLIPCKPLSGR